MADYTRDHMFFAASTVSMLAAAAYASFHLFLELPFDIPTIWRFLGIAALVWASQSISIMRVIITRIPALSLTWVRIGGYIAALFVTLVCCLVVRDLLAICLWAAGLLFPVLENLLHALYAPPVFLVVVAGSAFFAAFGMWSALRVPRLQEISIALPHLPQALEGLRIAHLSDLHVGSTFDGDWLQRVVEQTNAVQADLILITGDLVDGPVPMLAAEMETLKELKAPLGVLISVGNHEYYSGVMSWVEHWHKEGLTVLLNEHRVLAKDGESFVVAGITDSHAERYPGLLLPDPVAAMADAPEGFRILMAHQPNHAVEHAKLGYDLQLSGHTHGGQYIFLFPIVNLLSNGYRSGLYNVNGMQLYVSPGTGLWGYVPMRLGCPSEISILTLTRG